MVNTRLKLNHLPLEGYQARYTELLTAWEQRAFNKHFAVNTIEPTVDVLISINTGEVLDSVARPIWALSQVKELLLQAPTLGHVWFSDFFHPGLEALPYSRSHYRASSFLWAQTFDKFDFTNQFTSWMRPWEIMAMEIYEHVFVAHPLLKELIVTAVPSFEPKIHVVGLPFNHQAVFGRLGNVPDNRSFDCVYSSRFDEEKNPGFFLKLVEKCKGVRFAVCTGHATLKGTDGAAVRKAKDLASQGKLTIFENCAKETYYHTLASSKVQFNSAFQDWVSFTLLEALTFGCYPLYPSYRSFPDTLMYNSDHLYIPDDVSDAENQLMRLLDNPPVKGFDDFRMQILEYHSGTLDRIALTLIES